MYATISIAWLKNRLKSANSQQQTKNIKLKPKSRTIEWRTYFNIKHAMACQKKQKEREGKKLQRKEGKKELPRNSLTTRHAKINGMPGNN